MVGSCPGTNGWRAEERDEVVVAVNEEVGTRITSPVVVITVAGIRMTTTGTWTEASTIAGAEDVVAMVDQEG